MEDTEYKTVFEVKEITLSRSITIQREKRWEKGEFGLTLTILDQNEISLAKRSGDALLKAYIEEFEGSFMTSAEKLGIDLTKISWHRATGEQAGSYDRSFDVNNPMFEKVVKLLEKERAGVIGEWYVWLFKDSKGLGKKPAKW